jgi:hypothetical protein
MTAREQLHAYIAQLEQRLRLSTWLRGFAIVTGGALLATLLLVTIANALAFSEGSVTAARFALILILAIAAGAGLALPLRRLTRRRAIGTAEAAFPQFQQRLTTFTECDGQDPFIELLADDTLGIAQHAEPKEFVTDVRLWTSLGTAVGACAILLWMIVAGPGFLGYGASLLWTGPHHDKPALYDLRVSPGDAVVRRHADQMVSALPTGLSAPTVKVHARFQSSAKWEEIAMLPKAAGSFAGGYEFLFAGLPENVEYYVTAGAMTSKHFNIRVTDLPAVKQIRVTYHYPAWTGMPSEVEERGGDLRAVIGTEAQLDVSTDRPLPGSQIQLDNGQQIQLTGGENNVYHGTVKMDRDGVYHVAGLEQGQPVRVSEDFFIEARKANPPQISLVRPGHDYHASPIEEVTVGAKVTDEYGLNGVTLHYSVNGGPETTIDLLRKKGEKQADGSTTLSLENFKLVPGDLVSVYATAKDGNAEAHTDMVFIQADPYEREFSQSQTSGGGGGGGGGGGDPSAEISQREKEIIAQTFKQQGDKNATQQQAADIAKLLSQAQSTLHDQAVTLSGRLEARELTDAVKAISDFEKDMLAASQAMEPAAQQLQQQKWKDAIPNEQKALQSLLRAEATFRQIQVAFGAQGGGGGGGGAARDLAQLFELELDTQKNQYETPQNSATSAEQKAREIDDALKKLDELAKREEDLAQQQRNGTQTAEQKWQQEMLQREAQQLQQQMEQQLAQNGQQGQQSGQQGQQSGQNASASGQSSSGQSASGQSGGKPGQSSGEAGAQSADQAADNRLQAAQQALDRLRQANEDMKRAVSQSAGAAASRRAADRLREATDLLGGLQQQDAAGRLGSMAQTAEQLAARQKQQADAVRDLMAQQYAARAANRPQKYPSPQEVDKMVNDRQRVSDDLSRLTQQMRDAARELAPTQPGASGKLRSALEGMDENDLGTRLQRSSDGLRSGTFSDASETALTSDLQKLGQQVGEAARALGNAQHTSEEAALNRAMDDLSRLRDQLAGLGGKGQPGNQPGGQPGNQPSGQQLQTGQLTRGGQSGQSGQPGQSAQSGQPGQNGQSGQPGQSAQSGQPGQNGQQAGQAGGGQAGAVGNRLAGPVGNPGGGATNGGRNVNGGYDMGNTRIAGRAATPQQGPNPADAQREIDQGLNLLNNVRTVVQDSPEARRELQSLIDQMRNLDPSRFPGNPGLVEQMHQQLLSNVDALELQLRRQLDENQGGTIRNADPAKIPAGYQDSVAEYYRKLSGGGH